MSLDLNEQVGVVSWGYGCATSPGVYASVYRQRDWIINNSDYNDFASTDGYCHCEASWTGVKCDEAV